MYSFVTVSFVVWHYLLHFESLWQLYFHPLPIFHADPHRDNTWEDKTKVYNKANHSWLVETTHNQRNFLSEQVLLDYHNKHSVNFDNNDVPYIHLENQCHQNKARIHCLAQSMWNSSIHNIRHLHIHFHYDPFSWWDCSIRYYFLVHRHSERHSFHW